MTMIHFKKNLALFFPIFLIFILVACNTTSSSSVEDLTLQGSLSTSDSGGARLVLLETSQNEVTVVTIQADNTFSEDFSAGTYAIALVDEDNAVIAMLEQNGATIFDLSANTNLGSLSIDTETITMSTDSSLTQAASLSLLQVASSEVTDFSSSDLNALDTVGDNDNGLDLAALTLTGDVDGDLIPDFLDNDNNENGVFDKNEGFSPCAIKIEPAAGFSDGLADLQLVECKVFDNLKLEATELQISDGDVRPFSLSHVITMHISVPTSLTSLIASVEAISFPAYVDGTIALDASGFIYANTSTMTTYPTVSSNWLDYDSDSNGTGYNLPLASDSSGDVFSLWVNVVNDPLPALYQFKITLINGTVALITAKLNFVFNTPPRVTEITDGLATQAYTGNVNEGDLGTLSNPFVLDAAATTLTLTADRPLMQNGGLEICRMNHNAHIFYYDAAGNAISEAALQTPQETDTGLCDPATDLVHDIDVATYLPVVSSDGTPIALYKIDFTSVGENGDNSSEAFYFSF